MEKGNQIGRLALRHEGEWWNAYYARNETMDDAILLGSIPIMVAKVPAYKERFMELMRDIVTDIIADKTGTAPSWGGPTTAPEHERSGHG